MSLRVAQRPITCPAGHPVTGSRTLHCPTCGRLLRWRYARVCPNGHVVAGPRDMCPYCGETPRAGRAHYLLALGAVGVFALFVIVVLVADVPQRLIDWALSTYQSAVELVTSLPIFD